MNQSRKKILVIEDETICKEILTKFLRSNGFEVEAYTDGLVAIQDLENKKFECDAILTDLILPTISGIEIIKILKKKV